MKKLFLILTLFISFAAATQIKISEMPTHSGPLSGVKVPVVANGQNKSVDLGILLPIGDSLKYTSYWHTKKIIDSLKTVGWDIGSNNYAQDTVLLTQFNTAATSASNGWTKNSVYTSSATETVVSNGLRIVNNYTSRNAGNTVFSPWESAINDATTSATYIINSKGATLPLIGIHLQGATDQIPISLNVTLNLNNGELRTDAYDWTNRLAGTAPISFSNGDSVKLTLRRTNNSYEYTVINFTKNLRYTTSEYDSPSQGTSKPFLGNVKPGFAVSDGTYTLTDFRYYGHSFHPDLMVVGTSISTLAYGITLPNKAAYDSSIFGRIQQQSNMKVVIAAKAANKLSDALATLEEIRKMKPQTVIIEHGINDIAFSTATATWKAQYISLVDSLLAMGIKVVVEKITPNSYSDEEISINPFIDSAYGNHPNVHVLNVWNTTPIYTGIGNSAGSYSVDGTHLNKEGCKAVADYILTQLQNFKKPTPYAAKQIVESLTGDNRIDASAIKNLPSGGGLTDGDKGDITAASNGASLTIDNGAVTDAKINSVASTKVTGTKTSTFISDFTTAARGSVSLTTTSTGGTATYSSGVFNIPTSLTQSQVSTIVSDSLTATTIYYVPRESPSGTLNGSNAIFTLAYTPVSGSEMVFLNGLLQDRTNDYTISGPTITFVSAPSITARIRVTYYK